MTIQCDHCKNIIPPYSRIFCSFDKKFCSNACANPTTKSIQRIDPNYNNPHTWDNVSVVQKQSVILSVLVSFFSYF